jgi:hypothetical protein
MSCAGHLGSLVGGSGKGATQSTTSQDDAAAQNAEIQRNAARDQARTDAAQEKYRTGQEKRKQAEKDRVEKAREDKRQKVLEARSRADADPKSADAVDGYAKAVLDSDSLLRRDHAHSFDWSEQAEHAAGLTQKVASGVPGAQKKSHFYAQSGLLRERLDQKDEAVTAFERSLKENPGDLDVVESLLGLYANRKEPASASENLCKRTRRSVNGQENFYKLINLCVNMHPKRQEVSVPSGLAKLLPWVPAKELKQYKRWLGEGICKEDRMSECQSKCRCDPAQVVCSCKERCKTDANACMVPYLE